MLRRSKIRDVVAKWFYTGKKKHLKGCSLADLNSVIFSLCQEAYHKGFIDGARTQKEIDCDLVPHLIETRMASIKDKTGEFHE